jgi:hypothetical protein
VPSTSAISNLTLRAQPGWGPADVPMPVMMRTFQ